MNNNMDDGELYFVDSVKYFAPEIFVARLLKQREYSYLADELNIAISPRQVNKNLISFILKKRNFPLDMINVLIMVFMMALLSESKEKI